MLKQKLREAGVHFKINARKDAIQTNVSLWQAHAANGLCPPGTFGDHAKRYLKLVDENDENPF